MSMGTTSLLTGRPFLPDASDELMLTEAEVKIYCSLVDMGLEPAEASKMLLDLTGPELRHHVQTIMDLTPTRL